MESPATLALLCLLPVIGCSCQASHGDTAPAVASRPENTVPPGASSPAPRDDLPAAVARCADAYESFVGDPERSDVAAARIAESCADLYSESACANAYKSWSHTPVESRAARIASACRDAYCPKLAAPKPQLCQSTELPPPSRLLESWAELNQRILALELGTSDLDLLPISSFPMGSARAVAIPSPASSAALSATTITLRVGPKGAPIASIERESEHEVPASPSAADFATIAQLAARRIGIAVQAACRATKRGDRFGRWAQRVFI